MQQETHDPKVLPDLRNDAQDKRPWHAPKLRKFSVSSTEAGLNLGVIEDTIYNPVIS